MVGLIGCGCCNGGGGGGDYCTTDFDLTIDDDFSPDFDPRWDAVDGLVCVAGAAQCNTVTPSVFGATSVGYAANQMKKETLAGKIEVTVKIVNWPASNPFGTFQPYNPSVTLYGGTFGFDYYIRVAAVNNAGVNRYTFGRPGVNSQIGTLILPNIPQAGDVFGFRCLDFFVWDAILGTVKMTTVEVLLNGAVIFSEAGTLVLSNPCGFWVETRIRQPAINLPNAMILRIDDFAAVAQ
jgi:hypothetical protein